MGQRPVVIRIKVKRPEVAHEEYVALGVSDAARKLNISERTVYRMLKSGELERGNDTDIFGKSGRVLADINANIGKSTSRENVVTLSSVSDMIGNQASFNTVGQLEILKQQIEEKDSQIAHLMATQQDLTRTIQRLQEQMYELAHLVLTHNAAAAQAKAEAELKAQELQAKNRAGLVGLLGNKGRKT